MPKLAKIKLVFDRRKESETKGEGEISFYFYFANKKVAYVPTRIRIHPTQWDKKKGCINSEHENYLKLNNYFRNKINEFMNYELEVLHKNGGILTKETLNDYMSDTATDSFIEFAYAQIKLSDIEPTTMQSQNRSITILKEFQQNVTFSDITEDFCRKFTKHMRDSLEYSQNQIWKVHKDVRTYVNRGERMHKLKHENNPYILYKVKKDQPKHKYINYEQLKALEELKVPSDELRVYLDSFLFQCYTGLRISDLKILSGENFEMRGEHLVMKIEKMVKVNMKIFQHLHLFMDGKAEKLIKPYWEKYKDEKYIFGRRIIEQKSNYNLKLFQADAEITQKLTTHVGRHTFGTMFAKETGKPFLVMEYMGITKPSTAQIYIKLGAEL